MTTQHDNTLVAVFDQRGQAEGAIDELWHAGFAKDEVGVMVLDSGVIPAQTATGREEDNAASGAAIGAAAGGVTGAVAGALVTALVPGIGPVLAGGMLIGVGLAAGAAGGTYLGPFVAMGLSKPDAQATERELKAGRTILTVRANGRTDQALVILHSHGAQAVHSSRTA